MISSFQLYLIIGYSAIGWISYRRKKVDISGYASILVLTAALILSHSYALLTGISVTFICSAIITTIKRRFAPGKQYDTEGDAPRNWKQAATNMGVPVFLIMTERLTNQCSLTFAAFAALACATADTWSSEIGVLSRTSPVFIVSRKKVQPGVSGGVTILGTFCSIIGSLIIAFVYYCYYERIAETTCILILGFTGGLIDSLIGELFQAKYLSPTREYTDQESSGNLVKGFRIVTNNAVNLLAVALTAAIAYLLQYLLLQ
jgi:uncharacterized protein (TIGR00297 family)